MAFATVGGNVECLWFSQKAFARILRGFTRVGIRIAAMTIIARQAASTMYVVSEVFAGLLNRGSSNFTWHSMQELFFCADASVKSASTIRAAGKTLLAQRCKGAKETHRKTFAPLRLCARTLSSQYILIASLRYVSDNCHHDDVEKREHANDIEDQPALRIVRRTVNERNDK